MRIEREDRQPVALADTVVPQRRDQSIDRWFVKAKVCELPSGKRKLALSGERLALRGRYSPTLIPINASNP